MVREALESLLHKYYWDAYYAGKRGDHDFFTLYMKTYYTIKGMLADDN